MRRCGTKQPWATEALADGHRLLLLAGTPKRAVDPSRLHTYRCDECGAWHVGHARPRHDPRGVEPGRADWSMPRRRC